MIVTAALTAGLVGLALGWLIWSGGAEHRPGARICETSDEDPRIEDYGTGYIPEDIRQRHDE